MSSLARAAVASEKHPAEQYAILFRIDDRQRPYFVIGREKASLAVVEQFAKALESELLEPVRVHGSGDYREILHLGKDFNGTAVFIQKHGPNDPDHTRGKHPGFDILQTYHKIQQIAARSFGMLLNVDPAVPGDLRLVVGGIEAVFGQLPQLQNNQLAEDKINDDCPRCFNGIKALITELERAPHSLHASQGHKAAKEAKLPESAGKLLALVQKLEEFKASKPSPKRTERLHAIFDELKIDKEKVKYALYDEIGRKAGKPKTDMREYGRRHFADSLSALQRILQEFIARAAEPAQTVVSRNNELKVQLAALQEQSKDTSTALAQIKAQIKSLKALQTPKSLASLSSAQAKALPKQLVELNQQRKALEAQIQLEQQAMKDLLKALRAMDLFQ